MVLGSVFHIDFYRLQHQAKSTSYSKSGMCTLHIYYAAYKRISFLPVYLPYGVDFLTHCHVPGVLWYIQRVQHPSLMVSRSSSRDYIGYIDMPRGFCVKSLTTVSTLPHWVTTLTPLNGCWRSASLTSTTWESCKKRFKTVLLYWSS